MNWKPSTRQLEIIADMSNARIPPAAMASAVGLSLDEFISGRRRSLAAARAEEARHAGPAPVPPTPVAVAVAALSPKIVAERLFEGHPETLDGDEVTAGGV